MAQLETKVKADDTQNVEEKAVKAEIEAPNTEVLLFALGKQK
ncbi:MAG: hypothetical protein ACYCYE_04720 [Clostridia bacterium]